MDRSTSMLLAGALLIFFCVLLLLGRGRPMSPERRARTRKFLVFNGLWSTISAAWFTFISIAAGVFAAIKGDWQYVAIFAGCAVAMALHGIGQRWWRRREIARLDAGATQADQLP